VHERLRRFPSSAIIGVASCVGVEATFEVIIILVVVFLLARGDITLEVATRIVLIGILPPVATVHGIASAGGFGFDLLGVIAGDLFASFVPNEGGGAVRHLSDGLSRLEASICSLGIAHASDGVCAKVNGVSIHKITSKVVVGHCPP
jgi:hypothetical protein